MNVLKKISLFLAQFYTDCSIIVQEFLLNHFDRSVVVLFCKNFVVEFVCKNFWITFAAYDISSKATLFDDKNLICEMCN